MRMRQSIDDINNYYVNNSVIYSDYNSVIYLIS